MKTTTAIRKAAIKKAKKQGLRWWFIGVPLAILLIGIGAMAWLTYSNSGAGTAGIQETAKTLTPKYEFLNEDVNPEHLAKVLGSEEAYQSLAQSKLLVEWLPLHILNDPGNPIAGWPPTPWVVASMRGYVTKVSPTERVITIAFEGEEISFWVVDRTQIYVENNSAPGIPDTNIQLGEIKKGDYIEYASLFVGSSNLNLPECRGLTINRTAP